MIRITKIINRTLSFRLSLMVIVALATLLLLALSILFFYSRKAVKAEALNNAEQTLESTVRRIDNILLSVEQASGNIYWKMINNIHNSEKVGLYTQKLVEASPYITDCNIIFNTDSDSLNTNFVGWIDPQEAMSSEINPVGIFRLPLYDRQQVIGTMDVEVSLSQLSSILLETKPSPNSFCTMLRKDGTVIVHPDSNILNKNIFILTKRDDHSMKETAQAMISGGKGYKRVNLRGEDYYVFFKPFERDSVMGRAMTELGWSAAIVLPKDDIFGEYILLHYIVLAITFIGLTLLFISCFYFIRRQLLPLRKLEKSAKHIAEGFYDETIPYSRRLDEVGRLQNDFREMQKSLSTRVGEMQHLADTLKGRNEELQATYEQTKAADLMKTNFLHNMSDQMITPVKDIHKGAIAISNHNKELSEEEVNHLVRKIQHKGEKVTSILNNLIAESEKITN